MIELMIFSKKKKAKKIVTVSRAELTQKCAFFMVAQFDSLIYSQTGQKNYSTSKLKIFRHLKVMLEFQESTWRSHSFIHNNEL